MVHDYLFGSKLLYFHLLVKLANWFCERAYAVWIMMRRMRGSKWLEELWVVCYNVILYPIYDVPISLPFPSKQLLSSICIWCQLPHDVDYALIHYLENQVDHSTVKYEVGQALNTSMALTDRFLQFVKFIARQKHLMSSKS